MLIKKIFACFLVFFSISVFAQNIWIIKDIEFKGLKNFSYDEALNNVSFKINRKISQKDVKKSIQSLFKTGKFEDIKVFLSKEKITFQVFERPVIANVIITGNYSIDKLILDKYLNELNIRKGSIFSLSSEKTLIKTIKNFYNDIGRYKANIQIFKNFSTHNTVHLNIFIDEGSLIKINKIKLFGVKKFSEKEIMSLFQIKNKHSWKNIFINPIYSSNELTNDLNQLKSFYQNQGYFHFNISNTKMKYLSKDGNTDVEIYLFEGEKYRISNYFVNGNLSVYKQPIDNIININKNELYRKEKVDLIVYKIKKLLSEYGFIEADVAVEPEINYKNKTIVLNFNIDLKQKFFVNRIDFDGNILTKDKVLRRLIKQKEGEYFNDKLIESGKEALEKTRYFNSVKIFKHKNFNDSNKINILYRVQEESTGSINFGAGYGIDSGISFNASLNQDNIFGSGNTLKLSVIKNNNQKYADISTNYPYFIFNNTDLNTRFFYNDFKYNVDRNSNINKNTYGFESNIGFPVNDNNTINIGLGYSHNGIFKKHENTEKLLNNFTEYDSIVNDFTLNYSWMHNSFKYLYFPISGHQIYVSGKNTIPGSDNSFYKIILDSEKYIPLNKNKEFIFLNHAHIGIGNSFNEKKLPFYENFYVSNINSIRGFRANTIGPKSVYDNIELQNCFKNKNNLCKKIDSIGGNATIVSNTELIIPIPFISNMYSKFLRSSAFFDMGNVWDTKENNKNDTYSFEFIKNKIFKDMYASFGLSLQCFSPIGPINFSYAFPIQNHENYQIEPFQFSIGKNW